MSNQNYTLSGKYHQNRIELWICLASAFLFGIFAHGYMFFNNNISHDSFKEFLLTNWVSEHKIELGRIFVPLYRTYIGGVITSPWLMGIICLFCLGIAAFLIAKIFNIKSYLFMVLIAGILTINKTTISLFGTYIHDADCDMIAMLLSVLAVYLLLNCKKGALYGVLPLVITLGFYQSYISVTITLIIMVSILNLLGEAELKDVLHTLLAGAVMVIIAGLVYLFLLKITPILTGVEMVKDEYNSLTTVFTITFKQIIYAAVCTYRQVIMDIFLPFTYKIKILKVLSVFLNCIIIISPIIIVAKSIKLKRKELYMIVLLALALPLAMNFSRILTANMSHDLMHFALWLSYIFSIAILSFCIDKEKPARNFCKSVRIMVVLSIILTLFFNIRTANQLYIVKDLAYDANFSMMTRVLHTLEQDENYIPGKTAVAFIGTSEYLIETEEQKTIPSITGLGPTPSVVGASYGHYFKNILNVPILLADKNKTEELLKDEYIYNMPSFPSDGSMRLIDDIYVIKMGDYDMKKITK